MCELIECILNSIYYDTIICNGMIDELKYSMRYRFKRDIKLAMHIDRGQQVMGRNVAHE